MRGVHLHAGQLTGSPRELAGDRVHFAGMDASFLTGGAGFAQAAPAPRNGNGVVVGASQGNEHYGVLGIVILAVIVLFILDKAGFRFAVTAGKR